MTEEMSRQERELWDAQAQVEAWGFCLRVLEPWVQAAREIGHPELTEAMGAALDKAVQEQARAQDWLTRVELEQEE